MRGIPRKGWASFFFNFFKISFFGMETGLRPRHAEPLVTRVRGGEAGEAPEELLLLLDGWREGERLERRGAGMLKISISLFFFFSPQLLTRWKCRQPLSISTSFFYKTIIWAFRFCCWRL